MDIVNPVILRNLGKYSHYKPPRNRQIKSVYHWTQGGILHNPYKPQLKLDVTEDSYSVMNRDEETLKRFIITDTLNDARDVQDRIIEDIYFDLTSVPYEIEDFIQNYLKMIFNHCSMFLHNHLINSSFYHSSFTPFITVKFHMLLILSWRRIADYILCTELQSNSDLEQSVKFSLDTLGDSLGHIISESILLKSRSLAGNGETIFTIQSIVQKMYNYIDSFGNNNCLRTANYCISIIIPVSSLVQDFKRQLKMLYDREFDVDNPVYPKVKEIPECTDIEEDFVPWTTDFNGITLENIDGY